MADGEEMLDDFEAQLDLGAKVMEMADRLEPVDRVAPGAEGTYSFSFDGVTFRLVMTVVDREAKSEGQADGI